MEKALERALARKREIEAELNEISVFLRLHAKFAGTEPDHVNAERSSGLLSAILANDPPQHMLRTTEIFGHKKRGRPADFADMMEQISRESWRPLSRNEFVAEIEKRGVGIPSPDKARYIGTILWRNRDKFVNISGEGYILESLISPEDAAKARDFQSLMGDDEDVSAEESGDDN